ncbi:MAG: inositol monophosphatase family protein [Jatrophihabitantaceae bacterium]
MSARENDLPSELERMAIELATGAADIVRSARERPLSVSSKSTSTDLVTGADRESERWLVEQVARRRPGDSVLAEEGGAHGPSSGGVRWVMDPIDGTVNFVLGLPQYAVSVAAEVDGAVVAGAVCSPASGELFHAHAGGGAYLRGRLLRGPREVPLSRAVVGTGFGYDATRRARQAAVVAALLPRIADIRRQGAASLDLCAVAAGRLDAYFEAGLSPWDHAAGGLIAAEAGCVVRGLRGCAAGERMVVVAAPELIGELATLLEELGADRVSS